MNDMRYLFYCTLFFLTSCAAFQKGHRNDDQRISFTIVQVNDVYEIAPLSNEGGMARVATIKKHAIRSNPNSFLVMAGDFLSPSVYNSLKYDGKRIRGKQMIEAMNSAGVDYAVFGNHEFDITSDELQERLDESAFEWIASNTKLKRGDSIVSFKKMQQPLPVKKILRLKDKDGTTAAIGLIGITLPTTTSPYVQYEDPLRTAKKLYEELKDSCDAVIAITHQAVKDDIILAKEIPSLPLIVGGHEHDMRFEKVGNVIITKAHANAKTAYIIKVNIDRKTGRIEVNPELKKLDSHVPMDDETEAVVKKWTDRANQNYSSLGFQPQKILIKTGDSLEGRELYTRHTKTNLTELIVKAMQFACPAAEMVIMNAGSIRVDDVIRPPVSQYDILRSLPFGGSIREVEMKGALLMQILKAGQQNKGDGGFLHFAPAISIDPERNYRVALSDFLLTGGETNLNFVNKNNPWITKIYPEVTDPGDPRSDIRLAIVDYLTN